MVFIALGLIAAISAAFVWLPWWSALIVTGSLLAAVPLFFADYIKRWVLERFEAQSRVLRGAVVQVRDVRKVERWEVVTAPDSSAADRLLADADSREFRYYAHIDFTLTPPNTGMRAQAWDPWALKLITKQDAVRRGPHVSEVADDALVIAIWRHDGERFVAMPGSEVVGPQRLRLGIATTTPPPALTFSYLFDTFGVLNFPTPTPPPRLAWKDQPAQAFEAPAHDVPAPTSSVPTAELVDELLEKQPPLPTETAAYDGTVERPSPRRSAPLQTPIVAPPAMNPLSTTVEKHFSERHGDLDLLAIRPSLASTDEYVLRARDAGGVPSTTPLSEFVDAIPPASRAPTSPGAALKDGPPPRIRTMVSDVLPSSPASAWRFEPVATFDVYGERPEFFDPPPIPGLDVTEFRPIGKHVAPERFGAGMMPPPGMPELDRSHLARLNRAKYVYRVAVRAEPTNGTLEHLAHALTTASSLAREVDGIIRDTATGRTLVPKDARRILKSDGFDVREHLAVVALRAGDSGTTVVHTRGLAKFGRADLMARGIPSRHVGLVGQAMWGIADYLTTGYVVEPGETMQLGAAPIGFLRAEDTLSFDLEYGALRLVDAVHPNLELLDELDLWLQATADAAV